MSIKSVIPSNHLIFCHPLLLLPSIFTSIRGFSNESSLCIRWPKYWSFSFNISPSNEHPGLISFRMDWLDLLAVQGTLMSLLQHHSSKASILRHSAFFIVQVCWATKTSSGVICYGMKYRLSSSQWQLVSGSEAQGLLEWLSSLLLTSISGKQLSSPNSLPHGPQPWDFCHLPRVLSITWLLALFSSRMERLDFLSISHRPVSMSPSQLRYIPELVSQRLAFWVITGSWQMDLQKGIIILSKSLWAW